MICEALERNRSKQPRPNWGNPWKLVDLPSWSEIFPPKIYGDEGDEGPLVPLYWMEGLEGFCLLS